MADRWYVCSTPVDVAILLHTSCALYCACSQVWAPVLLAGCCLLSMLVLISSHAAAASLAASGEGVGAASLDVPLLGGSGSIRDQPPCLEAGTPFCWCCRKSMHSTTLLFMG